MGLPNSYSRGTFRVTHVLCLAIVQTDPQNGLPEEMDRAQTCGPYPGGWANMAHGGLILLPNHENQSRIPELWLEPPQTTLVWAETPKCSAGE